MSSANTDTTRTRQLDPEQQDALLEAAANEFAEHGFDGASVKAIADAANMTKPRIFYYFDGKEDLYAEVLSRLLDELLASAADPAPPEDADAFWLAFARDLEQMMRKAAANARGVALAQSLYRRGGDAPSYIRLLSRVNRMIAAWLEFGRRLGAVRTDVSVDLLCGLTTGALFQVDRAYVDADKWQLGKPSGAGTDGSDAILEGLVRIAKDALRQTVPAVLDVEINYANDDTPTTIDENVQVSEFEPVHISLRDGRQAAEAPKFETHAFQMIEAPVCFGPDVTDAQARHAYPSIEQDLMSLTGASKAMVFDHTIRRTLQVNDGRQPIHMAHSDYGKGAGERRLGELLGDDEARDWIEGGFLIVNLWQSIDGVIHSSPLAFVDRRTVGDEDFVPVTVEYGNRRGEIGYYRQSADHAWYWYSFLRPTEALVFKTYEPSRDGEHWSCPHSAFASPIAPPEAQGARSSIEFRVALALGKQGGE